MVSFRPLKESDYPLLFDWLQRPHVKEWWDDGDDTLAKVSRHYSSDPDTTFRYIVQSDDSSPIGYIQYYLEPDEVVGVDLLIGEPALLNQGIGTEVITTFVEMVYSWRDPKKIVIDPEPENIRAIRCYEKAGFVFDKIGLGEDGKQAYFMLMDRDV
ncbi:MAG: GNAT family N-acetyltransferase [bacterium]|nr:GNAT family N-acetyltransferase [Gammaproteobacteria bacterium]HIL83591.1 GNAT family N-acetyltransferase [Pseudomonadales bacterium]